MPVSGEVAPRRPAGRYDAPSLAGQRILAVLLALTVIALVAAVIRLLVTRAINDNPSAKVTGYSVVGDESVLVRFNVRKQAGSQAFCIVRARGADGREVGRDVAAVDPVGTQEKELASEYLLTTTARAVTGEVAGCSKAPISKEVRP